MKKIVFSIIAAAVTFACTKEQPVSEEQLSEKKGTTYTIELSSPDGEENSKITLGDYDGTKYTMKWLVGDVLQMYKEGEGSARTHIGTTEPLTAADIKDGKATFKFTTTEEAGTKIKFNLNSNLDADKSYGKSTLPKNQVQNGLGTDNTDITPYDYTFYNGSITLGTTTTVKAVMQRPLSLVKIPFWSTTYKGWKVEKITLSRNDLGQVAGCYTTNSANISEKSFTGFTASSDYPVISLTFNNEVSVPADAASAQPAFIQAFPTEKYQKDVTPTAVPYVVMIQISKDGVRKYFARKFTTVLESGKVKNFQVGLLEDTDSKFQVKEYSKIWERGCDMVFAGDTINRNKEGYTSMTKKAASELTYDIMNSGGLIFATDGTTASTIDLASSYEKQRPIANTKALTLVGDRIYDGAQTTLKVVEMRTYGDVLMANFKLIPTIDNTPSTPQYLFIKNSSDSKSTKLKLADCQIDATSLVYSAIGDGNGAVYSEIRLDNCIVKIKAGKNFYRLLKTDNVTERSIELNNNVFYWDAATSASASNILNLRPGSDYTAAKLTVSMSCNTIENCMPMGGIVYCNTEAASTFKDINVDKAIVYAHDQLTLQLATGKFLVFSSGTLGTCTNGYMAANNCYNSKGSTDAYIQPWNFTNKDKTNMYGSSCTACPFASGWDESKGYFPVDRSVVINGAGASYDTKYYFSIPE